MYSILLFIRDNSYVVPLAFGVFFELYSIYMLVLSFLHKENMSGFAEAAALYFAYVLIFLLAQKTITFKLFLALVFVLILTRMLHWYLQGCLHRYLLKNHPGKEDSLK